MYLIAIGKLYYGLALLGLLGPQVFFQVSINCLLELFSFLYISTHCCLHIYVSLFAVPIFSEGPTSVRCEVPGEMQ